MKEFAVHHIHVKNGREIYTISHDSGSVTLVALEAFINDIKKIGVKKHENKKISS